MKLLNHTRRTKPHYGPNRTIHTIDGLIRSPRAMRNTKYSVVRGLVQPSVVRGLVQPFMVYFCRSRFIPTYKRNKYSTIQGSLAIQGILNEQQEQIFSHSTLTLDITDFRGTAAGALQELLAEARQVKT